MKDGKAQVVEKQDQELLENNRCRQYLISGRAEQWMTLWTLVGCNTCGALVMACSFMWLNANMNFYHPSSIIQTITKAWKATLPDVALEDMKYAPPGAIFALFMLGAAMFSTTLVGWVMGTRPETRDKNVSWIRIGISLGLWISAGVTVEELFLVFMPFTISLDMILSSMIKHVSCT